MNYRKGQVRPQVVMLKLDAADSLIMDQLRKATRQASAQGTILTALREYYRLRDRSQDEDVENVEYRDLYFELAESTAYLRHAAETLIEQLDNAQQREKNQFRHLRALGSQG